MNVVDLSYGQERNIARPEDLFAKHRTTEWLAEALSHHVDRLTVIRSLATEQELMRHGVEYRFYRSRGDARWYIPLRLHAELRRMAPDIVHVHGLIFPLQVAALRRALPSTTAIVVQHHAEKPSSGIRLRVQRTLLPLADAFFFVAEAQADPWLRAGIIPDRSRIFTVMEGSTRFTPRPRAEARSRTGLTGSPLLLWVGRLNANKDPLALLDGFDMLHDHLPDARLSMIYHDTDLLDDIRQRIAASPFLARSVSLIGRVDQSVMEDFYNSADYFVLGSHYEGSGFALAEALACGCVPVVTDIPSFRAMTDDGRLGSLWTPGSAESFASALLNEVKRPWKKASEECNEHFIRMLSYEATGRITAEHYREIVDRRRA